MLRVIVAEDNEILRKNLIDLIAQNDGFEIVYSTDNGRQLYNVLKKTNPDVVITDIDMPEMTGVEAIRALRSELPDTEIIFVSAYDSYIKQAVELYAFDFIDKPLNPSRFTETLARIKRRFDQNDRLIEFKAEGSIALVKAKDVYFVEAAKKKTNIYAEQGEFVSTLSLKEVEELLWEDFFFKASRSYVVNLKKIRGIKPASRTSFEISFNKDGWLAFLSKNRYDEFRISLKKYFK